VVYNLQNYDSGGKWFGVVGFWWRVGMWLAYAIFFLENLSIFGNIPHLLHKKNMGNVYYPFFLSVLKFSEYL
jgi:hypothetical protein